MIADRSIERRIKQYDPHLYLKWNNEKQYFELWRHMVWGSALITPVTQSIYNAFAPIEFVQLDERLIWWIYAADSWKSSPKQHALESDNRWKAFIKQQDAQRRSNFYDRAKDAYTLVNAFYATKHAPKNDKLPKFNHNKRSNWSRPDIQSVTNPRLFSRSARSAQRLDFKR